jgi:Domain of unknown function (DUF397)
MIRDGRFRKATDSGDHGCVEVAALPQGGIRVRDSKDPSGPVLPFADDSWRAFVAGVKGGEFGLSPG